jgi:DNA (cytosine-5)-methyltransferase 1
MTSERPIAIDLFCGAGGLSTGLTDAGYDVQYALDSDAQALETYRANHETDIVQEADIRQIDPPKLGLDEEPDLIAGGPPCPTFSVVGRAKLNSTETEVVEDDRHQLWEEFVRIVEHYHPTAFIMENVEGMRSATNAEGFSVLSIICDRFRSLGYAVDSTVVDAANFGVPQHRKRLFIIGNRNGLPNPDLTDWHSHREPRPDERKGATLLSKSRTPSHQRTLDSYATESDTGETEQLKPWITVADAILDLPPLSPAGTNCDDESLHPPASTTSYTLPAVTPYQEWARNLSPDQDWAKSPLRNHEARFHNLTDLSIYKLLDGATEWTIGRLDDELQPYRADVFADSYTKQDPAAPASTIPAHLHKDGHMHIHPSEARSLTVREAARLQSFRDTFVFPVSRTAAYRQVGNAVPPLLAEAIGRALSETLLENSMAESV